jgi:putative DNA primase/helicase
VSDFVSAFVQALEKNGIAPGVPIVADGRLRRYAIPGDKKGKKNGWYRLTIEGNIAYGVFGAWQGAGLAINEKWFSKSRNEYTAADRERLKQVREQAEREEREAQEKAGLKARALWKRSAPVIEHPYATRKKIKLIGLREAYGKLVIPAYHDGKIVSVQFIADDGQKRFLTGGRKIGCYASIATKEDSREEIYICEGYATGASIYEAIRCPVVVAFDAGNLKPVAEAIRAKYPDSKIIIAGDNDQWTAANPGVKYATAAADLIGATVVWPRFPANAQGKPTDYNDLHQRAGLETVRAHLKPLQVARTVEENWKNFLIPGGKDEREGFPYAYAPKSKLNTFFMIKYHEAFAGMLIFNEFSNEYFLAACPPWQRNNRDEFTPRALENRDFFQLAAHLENLGIDVGVEVVAQACLAAAADNWINPPRDYFERLKWDGVPRLDSWLNYYLGAEDQPGEYLALVGSKWLIGAVARVYRPGTKFDTVLILEGEQNLGKSTVLRELATFHGVEYFLDYVGDLNNKDTLMVMQGKLIVEMSELASFKKSHNEEIKGFISRQVDQYREPYGRSTVKRPRYFVLGATTNEIEEGYFTDDTGNRRYWPVRCRKIDIDGLIAAREQLWAEAVKRYHAGERIWLEAEEWKLAKVEQHSRRIEDAWQERISDILTGEWETSTEKMCKALELKPRDINNVVKRRIKNSLKELGWYETKRAGAGRIWRRPGEKPENLATALFELDTLIE